MNFLSLYTISVRTQKRSELVSLNREIEKVIRDSSFTEGLCIVFVPHTTAGVTINENADPDVKRDILDTLEEMVPWRSGYLHMEGNSAAHIKASMMGFTQTLLVERGRLVLGTWQDVFLAEFDGPRERKIHLKLIGS